MSWMVPAWSPGFILGKGEARPDKGWVPRLPRAVHQSQWQPRNSPRGLLDFYRSSANNSPVKRSAKQSPPNRRQRREPIVNDKSDGVYPARKVMVDQLSSNQEVGAPVRQLPGAISRYRQNGRDRHPPGLHCHATVLFFE